MKPPKRKAWPTLLNSITIKKKRLEAKLGENLTKLERSSPYIIVKPLRENSHVPTEGWSLWKSAMVPQQTEVHNLQPRGQNQVGYICSSIRNAFPDQARNCGIYEWQARRSDQTNRVVYVGSTCRGKTGALRERILEYCRNGSHKKDLINDALRKGYELWVRVKISLARQKCREDAERMENELLAKYNYAWNIRNNAAVRSILPGSKP